MCEILNELIKTYTFFKKKKFQPTETKEPQKKDQETRKVRRPKRWLIPERNN